MKILETFRKNSLMKKIQFKYKFNLNVNLNLYNFNYSCLKF